MFGGIRKTLHPNTVSKLQIAAALACFGLAGILSALWEPSSKTALVVAKERVIENNTNNVEDFRVYVNTKPVTPELFIPQLGAAPYPPGMVTAKERVVADNTKSAEGFDFLLNTNPGTPESFIPQLGTTPSRPDLWPNRVDIPHTPASTSITLTSADALLTTHQVFANLLQPQGFKRSDWQAFDHIKLQDATIKPTSLSPVPSIAENSDTNADSATFTVLIDPGHGGRDPGSIAHNGLQEKHLTLDIARRVELFLSEVPDINVILTRTEDVSLRRKARVEKIKSAATDLVVSLHFNHLPVPNVNLVESFYASPKDIIESQKLREPPQASTSNFYQVVIHEPATYNTADLSFTRGSKRLANILHKRVYDEVSLDNEKVVDAGVKTDMLYVLTRSFTPGVLMELTAISNIEEAERLTDENYRNRLAAALVDGIRNYRDSLRTNPLNGTGT